MYSNLRKMAPTLDRCRHSRMHLRLYYSTWFGKTLCHSQAFNDTVQLHHKIAPFGIAPNMEPNARLTASDSRNGRGSKNTLVGVQHSQRRHGRT